LTELPIERFLLEVIDAVDHLGIRYMIMGGFAVRTWGIPRPTYDADLAIVAERGLLSSLLDLLAEKGFEVPEEHRKGFVDSIGGMGKLKVTRFEAGNVWDVDLFLVRGSFLESAISRRRQVRIGGRPVWVTAPEDILLLKLIAFRRKDQLDIEEIIKISPDLDRTYLEKWGAFLGVTGRLEEFLS
jgi:predicted nucleotidyltransferase